MREFVPGYGPALGGEANQRLEGVRAAVNAAGVAPAPAATSVIFAAGEAVTVVTRVANERVRATLTVTRTNASLAGNGRYQILVDGVANGILRNGPFGPDQTSFTFDEFLEIAAVGTHVINAQVTSNTGAESVSANARMIVQANEFAVS